MTDIFELADALGPLKTIHIHEPSIGLQGILVIDNVAIGPCGGAAPRRRQGGAVRRSEDAEERQAEADSRVRQRTRSRGGKSHDSAYLPVKHFGYKGASCQNKKKTTRQRCIASWSR